MWKKGNLCALLMGSQISTATMENSMGLPQKLKIELPYDSAIPLLGIYLKKFKTLIWKDLRAPVFIVVLFTIAKT